MNIRYVSSLPDLMTPEDYLQIGEAKKVRIRIQFTDDGIEILGDSMYPKDLEKLLSKLDVSVIERTLCG